MGVESEGNVIVWIFVGNTMQITYKNKHTLEHSQDTYKKSMK